MSRFPPAPISSRDAGDGAGVAVAGYLADKSAVTRWHHPPERHVLGPLIEHGLIATSGVMELKVLFSASDRPDYHRVASGRRHGYEWLPTEDNDLRRALYIQAELADRGQRRALSLPELIIAAVAERHRVCVLHYDRDFEHVAGITGQATRWVVPQGSIT